jgi:hypothetical protein
MIRYRRNEKTLTGQLHDELVMMDIDQGKYFSLNNVGTRIWELLENPMSQDELCSALMEEYEVDEEQCREETGELLREMGRLGLVVEG